MIEIYKDPKTDSVIIVRYSEGNEDPDDLLLLDEHLAELEDVPCVPAGWAKLEMPS